MSFEGLPLPFTLLFTSCAKLSLRMCVNPGAAVVRDAGRLQYSANDLKS